MLPNELPMTSEGLERLLMDVWIASAKGQLEWEHTPMLRRFDEFSGDPDMPEAKGLGNIFAFLDLRERIHAHQLKNNISSIYLTKFSINTVEGVKTLEYHEANDQLRLTPSDRETMLTEAPMIIQFFKDVHLLRFGQLVYEQWDPTGNDCEDIATTFAHIDSQSEGCVFADVRSESWQYEPITNRPGHYWTFPIEQEFPMEFSLNIGITHYCDTDDYESHRFHSLEASNAN